MFCGGCSLSTPLENAMEAHIRGQGITTLLRLYATLSRESVIVPLGASLTEMRPGVCDAPCTCIRGPNGQGSMLVFTSMEYLRLWRPEGCKWMRQTGSK